MKRQHAKRTFTQSRIEQASAEHNGFCIGCGHEQGECEPDVRGFKCEDCGQPKVYGTAELVLMGNVR